MTETLTQWYVWIMLGVFPLWTGWTGYSHLTAQKFGFFLIATAVWSLALLTAGLREHSLRIRWTGGQIAVCGLLVGLCLSAVCSPWREETFLGAGRYDGVLTWALYAVIFWGVSRYGKPNRSWWYALAVGSVGNCVVALLQLTGRNCLWLFPGPLNYYDAGTAYTGEFLGLIGNVDVLSAYFCLTIPLFLTLFVTVGNRGTWPLLAVGALNGLVLLESGVDGGIAGLLLAAGIGAPLLLTDSRRMCRECIVLAILLLTLCLSRSMVCSETGILWRWDRWNGGLTALAAVLLLVSAGIRKRDLRVSHPGRILAAVEMIFLTAVLGWLYAVPPDTGTLRELSLLLHGQVSDTFGSNRVTIWKEVWRLIQDRPVLGGGPDTLRLRSDLTFSRYAETGTKLTVRLDNAHNECLNLWVNGGLVSLVPYLVLMAATLCRGWKYRNHRLLLPVLLSLIAWWGQALFGLGLCIVMPLLWILWAAFWAEPQEKTP